MHGSSSLMQDSNNPFALTGPRGITICKNQNNSCINALHRITVPNTTHCMFPIHLSAQNRFFSSHRKRLHLFNNNSYAVISIDFFI